MTKIVSTRFHVVRRSRTLRDSIAGSFSPRPRNVLSNCGIPPFQSRELFVVMLMCKWDLNREFERVAIDLSLWLLWLTSEGLFVKLQRRCRIAQNIFIS